VAAPGQDPDRVLQGRHQAARPRAHLVHLLGVHLPRPQGARRNGRNFTSFLAAISKDALNKLSGAVCRWRLHRRTGRSLADLASWINPIVRGWMQDYGAYYRSARYLLLRRINAYLVRWLRKKFKRLGTFKKAHACWQRITRQQPNAFAHWAWVPAFW
jgi:RNA-directed DNA polymerase